eukprot:3940574-Rhodomonas_salina.1
MSYAVNGTELAYGATSLRVRSEGEGASSCPRPHFKCCTGIPYGAMLGAVLSIWCYARSGTELAYGAMLSA